MASTRNINTPGNFCLEERDNSLIKKYALFPNSQYGAAYLTKLPGNGLLPGHIPWNKLSENAADTESFLMGINSTNLVNPAPLFVPQIVQLDVANIFKNRPIFIPEPLVVEKNQRPLPLPK